MPDSQGVVVVKWCVYTEDALAAMSLALSKTGGVKVK